MISCGMRFISIDGRAVCLHGYLRNYKQFPPNRRFCMGIYRCRVMFQGNVALLVCGAELLPPVIKELCM